MQFSTRSLSDSPELARIGLQRQLNVSLVSPRSGKILVGGREDVGSDILTDSKEWFQINIITVVLVPRLFVVILLLEPGEAGLKPLGETLRDGCDLDMANQAVGKRDRDI